VKPPVAVGLNVVLHSVDEPDAPRSALVTVRWNQSVEDRFDRATDRVPRS